MKKILMKIFATVISTINLLCGWCYADVIASYEYVKPAVELENIVPMIIIGALIIAIVVAAIIILIVSKKNKDEETKNEK